MSCSRVVTDRSLSVLAEPAIRSKRVGVPSAPSATRHQKKADLVDQPCCEERAVDAAAAFQQQPLYCLVELGLVDEVIRITMFRRDLIDEILKILSPLFGGQSWKRCLTKSKVGSEEEDPEQAFHGSTLYIKVMVGLGLHHLAAGSLGIQGGAIPAAALCGPESSEVCPVVAVSGRA
jgi:hypothetical protein